MAFRQRHRYQKERSLLFVSANRYNLLLSMISSMANCLSIRFNAPMVS